uniref:Cadmium-induced protein AS8 n=1 Tax=Kalanchoe fedtschenkoi TaxID=63787 RepID=A0A7N0UZ17_KALFE
MKGVLRGYENWNPVHPTLGAFWGMGIGVGCGIGWGPGFGPEVIGYVGAGCGVGFNVGVTLIGLGIGLPAHSLMGAPYNAMLATRNGVLELGRLGDRCGITAAAGDGWTSFATCVTNFQREVSGGISSFKTSLRKGSDD